MISFSLSHYSANCQKKFFQAIWNWGLVYRLITFVKPKSSIRSLFVFCQFLFEVERCCSNSESHQVKQRCMWNLRLIINRLYEHYLFNNLSFTHVYTYMLKCPTTYCKCVVEHFKQAAHQPQHKSGVSLWTKLWMQMA